MGQSKAIRSKKAATAAADKGGSSSINSNSSNIKHISGGEEGGDERDFSSVYTVQQKTETVQ